MKRLLLILILISGLTLTSYAQVLVSHDQAEELDFSQYKTFKIYKLDIKTMPEFEPRQEGINRLTHAIADQMTARGFNLVKDDPDLIINLGVTIAEEVQTRESDIRDAPRYMGQRNYHWESEEIVVQIYTEGTVVMDVVDSGKNEMIWQAVVKSVISEKKREKNQKKIDKAAVKMFKKFPVAPIE